MKKNWEVLIQGNNSESKDIFEQIEKVNTAALLKGPSRISEEEAEKRIEVLEERDDEFGLEISVIRKDNEHGHESYGCGGENKIILWDSSGTCSNEMYTGSIGWCKQVAELLCEAMNKKGM